MSKKTDLQGQLEERRRKLNAIFEQAGENYDFSKVTLLEGDDRAKADAVQVLNAEMNDLGKQVEDLDAFDNMKRGAEAMAQVDQRGMHPSADANRKQYRGDEEKTFGELVVESDAYRRMNGSSGPAMEIALPGRSGREMRATLFQTSAGWAPEKLRSGVVVPAITRPLQVIDLVPTSRTNQVAVTYMKETVLTNNAAETAEAGTYPESALQLAPVESLVRKIATFLPVTDEQLEDVAGIQSYIEERLGFMIMQRLDSQILVGNGVSPNLLGLNNLTAIQTQPKGADPVPDAIYKAMTLIRVNGRATPSGLIMHPTDWQDVKLLRTADGIYIWGNPAENAPDRIWGMQVALSDAQTLNTALLGDFSMLSLAIKKDVEVHISNSHSTYFIEGKQAIRVEMRCALVCYRDEAFVKITGV